MNPRWPTVRLGDEVTLLSGGTPKKSEPRYWGGNIPWVSSGEMKQRRISDTELHVTDDGADNGTRRVPEKTVLIVVRGMSLAKEFRVAITQREITFNQDLKALVQSEKVDSGFLFYYLLSQNTSIRDSATEASHGTKKLETCVLQDWPLPIPSLNQQREIVSILSAYDDLIENNLRRIRLLEESARLLYRECFVRLRFPGHEHTRIIDGVPEGWERTTAGELSMFLKRGITPKYDEDGESTVINQKCIRNGSLDLGPARRQSKEVPPLKRVRIGDVLVNSTGQGTLGRVAQVKAELEEHTVDSHVTIVRPSQVVGRHYFGQVLLEYEPLLASMGRGATNQTELSRDDIAALPVILPEQSLAIEYENYCDPLFQQTTNLTMQCERLRQARDLLIPKLMSGEITA